MKASSKSRPIVISQDANELPAITVSYVISLLLVGLVVRLFLGVSLVGSTVDQNRWYDWMENMNTFGGLAGSYLHTRPWNDPPLFLFVLDAYRTLLANFGVTLTPSPGGSFWLKLPAIGLDIIASALILLAGKGLPSGRKMLVATILTLNPALLFNSSIGGQVDILYSTLTVLAVFRILEAPFRSGIWFGFAMLTRFHSIVVLPIFVILMLRIWIRSHTIRPFARWIGGLLVAVLPVLSFFALQGTLGVMFQKAYLGAVNTSLQVTGNAMNIWRYVIGTRPNQAESVWLYLDLFQNRLGLFLLALTTAYVVTYLSAKRKLDVPALLKAGMLLNFSSFMLLKAMHARDSIPALVFGLLLVAYERKWMPLVLVLTVTIFLNLEDVIYPSTILLPGMTIWIAVLNTALLVWMFASTIRELRHDFEASK